MKLRYLALVAFSLTAALPLIADNHAPDESNLVLLDTVNPAIRELAETAGDASTYDSLNEKNKIGVFYSEGPVLKTFINENTVTQGYALNLLSYPWKNPGTETFGAWTLDDFIKDSDPTFPLTRPVMFATNGHVLAPDLPENRRNLPQFKKLPTTLLDNTKLFPWSQNQTDLRWNVSDALLSEFNGQILDSTDHVKIYKRFEFPSGLNYTPSGSGIFGAIQDYDTDRANISDTAKKFVIVIHGWNTSPMRDPYADRGLNPLTQGNWPHFFDALHKEMQNKRFFAPDWDLYAYRWGQDSYTGNVNGNDGPLSMLWLTGLKADADRVHAAGGVGAGVENGTQAAEIGYQHGLVLGKLIWDHCRNRGIPPEKIQFIAHSAGTWVARSASLFLHAKYGNSLVQQITLLDPYNPRAGHSEWLALGSNYPSNVDNSDLRTDLISSDQSNAWTKRVDAAVAENIYSMDVRVPGTNSVYGGNFVNTQVGTSAFGIDGSATDFGAHSGPIRYYTFSVNPSYGLISGDLLNGGDVGSTTGWAKSTKEYISLVGWKHSLFMQETKPPAITKVGASILLILPSSSSRSGLSFAPAVASPWKQILVDVDENAWVRAMLLPTNGGAAELAGPARMEDNGTFALNLSGGKILTGSFDTGVTPAALTLAVNGVAFGQKTSIAQGSNARRGVDSEVNAAGNVVFSMSLANGTIGMSILKDDSNTGWAASGIGTVNGTTGNFAITGGNGLQVTGQLGQDGGLDSGNIIVTAPIVPEIHVMNAAGLAIHSNDSIPAFAVTEKGKSSGALKITIKNTGTVSLTGLAVTVGGTNPTDFKVSGLAKTKLVAGTSTTFEMVFAPTATGKREAVIRIASNDADENPFNIGVSGVGMSKPEIRVEQPKGKSLQDGVTQKSFGTVTVKSSASMAFTIKNIGSATLKNLTITTNGTHAKDFIVTQSSKTSLASGASTAFKVTFKPSNKGSRKAAIHIRSNDADENPFDITLTGNGVLKKSISAGLLAAAQIPSFYHWFASDGLLGPTPESQVINTTILDGRKYLTLTVGTPPGEIFSRHTVEVSPNLIDWYSGNRHTTTLQDTEFRLKVRDNTPLTSETKRYIRLKPSSN